MQKKVLLAEDHAIVTREVKIIFEVNITGYELDVVKTCAGMMECLQQNSYCMAIIDLQLEDGHTLDLIEEIRQKYPAMDILIFTANAEDLYADRMYKAGVKGYVNKRSDETEMASAINEVLNGGIYKSEAYLSLPVGNNFMEQLSNPFEKLSAEEKKVAGLMQLGKRTSEISAELTLSSELVKHYKSEIFTKLAVSSIPELQGLFLKYSLQ